MNKMQNNIYRTGIYFDYEKTNYFKKAYEFMGNTKNANVVVFIGAVLGTVATVIGAYYMGVM